MYCFSSVSRTLVFNVAYMHGHIHLLFVARSCATPFTIVRFDCACTVFAAEIYYIYSTIHSEKLTDQRELCMVFFGFENSMHAKEGEKAYPSETRTIILFRDTITKYSILY